MKIKIDTKGLTIARDTRNILEAAEKKAQTTFAKQAAEQMKKDVVDTILRGNSPVKNFKRFEPYSDSYKSAIRKGRYRAFGKLLRPVNLKLSGRLLKSIAARQTLKGFTIYFTNKLAKIHSILGAGKKKVIRKLFPSGNEKWKESVVAGAKEIITNATEKEIAIKMRRI